MSINLFYSTVYYKYVTKRRNLLTNYNAWFCVLGLVPHISNFFIC